MGIFKKVDKEALVNTTILVTKTAVLGIAVNIMCKYGTELVCKEIDKMREKRNTQQTLEDFFED